MDATGLTLIEHARQRNRRYEFHLTTAGAWDVMSEACESATASIDFEQYIVKDDPAGHAFLDLLARKAREGVRVRIILDALGSRDLLRHAARQNLIEAGAEVVFYHERRPGHWLRPLSWFPRTHAKLLHVDGATFLGSMCLADYMRSWRDTMVLLHGDLATAAQKDFDNLWHDLDDGQLDGTCEATEVVPVAACYAAQNPKGGHYPLYDALVEAITGARREVCIATPYFFPPKRLRQALTSARQRGVRISLMLSHATDVPVADCVTAALLPVWRRCGYEVQLYQSTVLHAKYAVVDDAWATVGSCNFDYLSLCCNREANIVFHDHAAIRDIRHHFDQDLRHCRPATVDDERSGGWSWRLKGRIGAVLLHQV